MFGHLLFGIFLRVFFLLLEAPAPEVIRNGSSSGGVAEIRFGSAIRIRILFRGQQLIGVGLLLRLVDRVHTFIILDQLDFKKRWHGSAFGVATVLDALLLFLYLLILVSDK